MLIRRINYLEYDDELLRKFARPDLKDMNLDEVKLALEERGVYVPAIPVPYSLFPRFPTSRLLFLIANFSCIPCLLESVTPPLSLYITLAVGI